MLSDSTNTGIRFGQANGTFSAAVTMSTGTGYGYPSLEDLNKDGRTDLLFWNNNGIATCLANGDGTFQARVTYTSSANFADDYTLEDITGDGYADAFIPGYDSHTFFKNNGDGTFTQAVLTPVQQANTELRFQFSDFNGDGVKDLMTMNDDNSSLLYFYLQQTETSTTGVSLSLNSQSDAQNALGVLDTALKTLNDRRASIGATMNRLDSAYTSTSLNIENISQALSSIRDADIAAETAELAKLQIAQQAATSVLAQANFSLRAVLELLRGIER